MKKPIRKSAIYLLISLVTLAIAIKFIIPALGGADSSVSAKNFLTEGISGRFILDREELEGVIVTFEDLGDGGSSVWIENFEPKELWQRVDWSHIVSDSDQTSTIVTWPKIKTEVSFTIIADTRPNLGDKGREVSKKVRVPPAIVLFE